MKTFLAIDELAESSAEINKPLTGQKLSCDMNCSALPLVGNYHVTILDLLLVTNCRSACAAGNVMASTRSEERKGKFMLYMLTIEGAARY